MSKVEVCAVLQARFALDLDELRALKRVYFPAIPVLKKARILPVDIKPYSP